jgi:hypothetical protein
VTEPQPWRRTRAATPEPYLGRLQKRMARGDSLEEAAAHCGLELWRAKATFVRSGLPVPKPVRRRLPRDESLVALGARVHEHLVREDRARYAELARALAVPQSQVRQAIWPEDVHRILPPLTSEERYPDWAILLGLQTMSVVRGRLVGGRGRSPVPAPWWDSHRDPAALPNSVTVAKRFGGWRQACEAAGIPVHGGLQPARPRRTWTEQECLEAVGTFFRGGHGWSPQAYDTWARDRGAPSRATISARFGSWPALRTRMLA